MNDFPGYNWMVRAHSDHDVEHYNRECILFCGALILIAALVLFIEGNVKYYAWAVLLVAYLFNHYCL